jgi:hypothetical protein
LFGGDDRVHEFLGRTLGTGLAPAFRREEQAVLVARPQEQSAPTGDHAIRQAEVGSALAGATEDE